MANRLDYNLYPCRGKQIRLLKPQQYDAAQADDTLRYSMEVASLDDAPEYAAVSYVWGQGAKVAKILVGDSFLEVSASAERALRYFSLVRMSWVGSDYHHKS